MAVLIAVVAGTAWPGDIDDSPTNVPLELISEKLFADYGAPFVLASALLLVALIGAIILARQEEGE
jgi:NADH:ubiquinone oxidoreductase subunit 6 (subunit J)